MDSRGVSAGGGQRRRNPELVEVFVPSRERERQRCWKWASQEGGLDVGGSGCVPLLSSGGWGAAGHPGRKMLGCHLESEAALEEPNKGAHVGGSLSVAEKDGRVKGKVRRKERVCKVRPRGNIIWGLWADGPQHH